MSQQYEFVGSGLYLQPTPAGAYHAVASPEPSPERQLLLATMRHHTSVRATPETFAEWCGQPVETALATVHRAQEHGWLEGFQVPHGPAPGPLEPIAADAVQRLSSSGHGLLADGQGFCVASHGFDLQQSEFLAAVSADIASLHERHAAYLADAAGSTSSAWAMVDMAGNSRVGFWPLFVGRDRFVLALGGLPALNQTALVELVWALTVRYGSDHFAAGG
ncbi:MAG: hypothetical protein HY828_12785 [Actinobacteria bacterium]|nr:hypothetical protein [Actinomycetota bacterium]